jgi:putative hemolysin
MLILLSLLMINALFAMSEIAVVSSRRVRLEQLAARGDHGAKMALKLSSNPTRFLSTVQIGITVTAILAGAFGEKALVGDVEESLKQIDWLKPAAGVVSVIVVMGGITFLSLLLGELVPKRIGMAFPEVIARATAGLMLVISRIASPLVTLLTFSTNLILATLRIRPPTEEEHVSEDEVRAMIFKGKQAGVFHEAEQRLLERVLRLDDLKARALMVPRTDVTWLDVNATADMMQLTVATSPFSHFPVCDGELDTVIGFVHVKDLVKHGLVSGGQINLRELAHPVLYVPENTLALKLLDVFRTKRMHIAMVVDEYGAIQGLITLNDIVDVVLGTLPGQGDDGESMLTVRDDGSILVDGRLPLDELARALGIDPHDFAVDGGIGTVAGLVLVQLGHVPKSGEKAVFRNVELEVVDMDRARVDKVIARRMGEAVPA